MRPERRLLEGPVEVETRAEGGGSRLKGTASVFYDGTPTTEFSLWDGFKERIMPGAFDRALREDDVRGLFNHDPSRILGRTSASTMRLSVSPRGLAYEIDAPDSQQAKDVVEAVRRRDVTGSSFAFRVTDEQLRKEGNVWIREIKGVRLFDVGPVTFPAYEATEVSVDLRQKFEAKMGVPLVVPRARRQRLLELGS